VIKQYVGIVRRWLWLLLLVSLLASFVAYAVLRNQPVYYDAAARLIIGPGVDGINPDLNDLRTGGQLMQTYAELVTTRPVLQTAIDQLNLTLTPDDLKRQISVRSDDTTQILRITVQNLEPAQAITIVNTLANVLVEMSPSGTGASEQQIKVRMADHITKLEDEAAGIERAMVEIQARLQSVANPETGRLLEAQLAQERSYLADVRRTLSSFYTNFQDSYTNQVKIIELSAGAAPIDANLNLSVMLAGLAGLILALVIVVGYEYLNDTITTTEDLALVTDIPLLGTIARHKPLARVNRKSTGDKELPESLIPDGLRRMYKSREQFVVQALPESRTTENYRMLGSKLLLSRYRAKQMDYRELADQDAPVVVLPQADVKYPLGSVVISGAQIGEDTSEITANLAVILAQTGHRVILVDAYLHHPTIAQKFGISDEEGLTTVLRGQTKQAKLTPVDWVPNLFVLPSGPIPTNPFELLVSNRMANLIHELESQAGIVLINTSPLLAFADSLILASRTDGVIVVVHSGRAKGKMVSDVVSSLRSLDANIIGAIFDYNHAAQPLSFVRAQASAPPAAPTREPAKNPVKLLGSAKS